MYFFFLFFLFLEVLDVLTLLENKRFQVNVIHALNNTIIRLTSKCAYLTP